MTDLAGSLKIENDDDVMLFWDIEKSFGYRMTTVDFAERGNSNQSGPTAGDIFQILINALQAETVPRRACLSLAVFHRLRRHISQDSRFAGISPKSELAPFFVDQSLRRRWQDLGRETKLKLPELSLSRGADWAVMALFFGSPALGIFFHSYLAVALGWAVMMLILSMGPRTLPRDCKTMSDLVQQTLARNFRTMSLEYEVNHPKDVWQSLCVLLRSYAGNRDLKEILPETRLFDR
jgi:hypothetical protein